MEVNQILMMPTSFGGWQSHDDLIYLYARYDNDACIYFLLALPPMSNIVINTLWSAADLWSLTRRTN
jgi:hypothetical protein